MTEVQGCHLGVWKQRITKKRAGCQKQLERQVIGVIFFFQAEDGIRDIGVTGVQTCALPIWRRWCASSLGASVQRCSWRLPPPSTSAGQLTLFASSTGSRTRGETSASSWPY